MWTGPDFSGARQEFSPVFLRYGATRLVVRAAGMQATPPPNSEVQEPDIDDPGILNRCQMTWLRRKYSRCHTRGRRIEAEASSGISPPIPSRAQYRAWER